MNRRRKRRAVIAGVVGLASLAAVGSASILSPSIVQATSHCGGTERWDVKTLSDAAADPAARVVGYRAKDTTIDRLREQVLPEPIGGHEPRLAGVETQVWRLTNVYLVDARLVRGGSPPGDEDIHLVIRDRHATHKMIVEFPDIRCRGASVSHRRARIERARDAFLGACGGVPRSFVGLGGRATLTGVGFFDKKHGQRGIAPNGVELHPVLSFRSTSCERD